MSWIFHNQPVTLEPDATAATNYTVILGTPLILVAIHFTTIPTDSDRCIGQMILAFASRLISLNFYQDCGARRRCHGH